MAGLSKISENRLSFQVLKRNVIDKDLCALCYGCVSFCTANELHALGIKEDKPIYLDESKCLKCGICYLICPRTEELDEVLINRLSFKDPIGSYIEVKCLQTTNKLVRNVCCDGGVVTSILKFLLDTRRIDGAVLVERTGIWNSRPLVATNFDDLLKCAGSKLSQTESLIEMGKQTTYASIFEGLKKSRIFDLTRLAIVGSPCQIKTIQKMRLLRIFPSTLIKFSIGLFCFENFIINEHGKRYLKKKIKTQLGEIKKINLKDKMIVNLRNGKTLNIALDELNPIVRQSCLACTDFSNFSADISVGGLGSPEGYTTVIVRNHLSKTIVDEAIRQGYIIEIAREGMVNKIFEMAKKKMERGQRIFTERKGR